MHPRSAEFVTDMLKITLHTCYETEWLCLCYAHGLPAQNKAEQPISRNLKCTGIIAYLEAWNQDTVS